MSDAVVGIVANPLSGRDIRRLVARATVFPTTEKAGMVLRLLAALGSAGVRQALVATDLGGISATVARGLTWRGGTTWPEVAFLDGEPVTQTAADTTAAVRRMVAQGARVVVCLGGDGTARVAAEACGDVPLLPLSTGTNNTYARMTEATVAGLAAALVATGAVPAAAATTRSPLLRVRCGEASASALVDVAVSTTRHRGARAVWDPAGLTELFCTFAEPGAIGLSSIPALVAPCPRTSPDGVAVRLGRPARTVVLAPLAPGLVLPVEVADLRPLRPGRPVTVATRAGVVAVDGERELEFGPDDEVTIVLDPAGPHCIDVGTVLSVAARDGLLSSTPDPQEEPR